MNFRNSRSYLLAFSIVLALILLLNLNSCTNNPTPQNSISSASILGQISANNKLKVGYLVFPPAIIKNQSTGELSGHFIDTIKEIGRTNNWNIDFIETDWANFAVGLNSRRFDVSIVPTFVTVKRALAAYFTTPLFYAGNSAIVRLNEKRFTNLEAIDQSGVTVAVTQGEAGDEYARANFKKAKIIRFSGGDQSLAFQAVIANRADIALGDAYVTSKFAKANSQQVRDLFATSPYNLTPVSWAVRRGEDELLNFLNNCLETFDYQDQIRKWEQIAGANWLHLKKTWEFSNNTSKE